MVDVFQFLQSIREWGPMASMLVLCLVFIGWQAYKNLTRAASDARSMRDDTKKIRESLENDASHSGMVEMGEFVRNLSKIPKIIDEIKGLIDGLCNPKECPWHEARMEQGKQIVEKLEDIHEAQIQLAQQEQEAFGRLASEMARTREETIKVFTEMATAMRETNTQVIALAMQHKGTS